MGCAPMAYLLWKQFMSYNPKNPKWVCRSEKERKLCWVSTGAAWRSLAAACPVPTPFRSLVHSQSFAVFSRLKWTVPRRDRGSFCSGKGKKLGIQGVRTMRDSRWNINTRILNLSPITCATGPHCCAVQPRPLRSRKLRERKRERGTAGRRIDETRESHYLHDV